MAKRKGQFEKGVSGNPNGRPKLTPEDKAVRQLTRETWNDLSQKMMTLTQTDMEEMLARGGLPFEVDLFIRHMLKLGETPDWHAYERYLARRIGPVKQEIELSSPKPIVIEDGEVGAVTLTYEEKEE